MTAQSAPVGPAYDTGASSRLLWEAYGKSGRAQRLLAAARPYIARFDRVMPYMPDQGRVLDIGCGNGLLLTLAHAHAHLREAVGIDVNARALAGARSMAARQGAPFTFVQASDPKDWPAGTFDAVLMMDVMHHVPKAARPALIQAAADRVAPGGVFVYKDMCGMPFARWVWNQVHDLLLASQWVQVEPIEHVIGWAKKAGLHTSVSERYVGAGLYGHELEVFRRPPNA